MNPDKNPDNDGVKMYMLTNCRKMHGASVLLYPATLSFVEETVKENFYIIPASIHELLILPQSAQQWEIDPVKELSDMIYDINMSELEAEEVLTDHAFFYDYENKRLKQL